MSQSSATLSGRTDEMISAAVRGLIAQRRDKPAQVAMAVGVSRAALYRKLGNDSPWQAEEVDRLAQHFGVSRDSLYEGRAEYPSAAERGAIGNLAGTSTRSSTDRASDYGSEAGQVWSPFQRPERRRRMAVIPLYLVADHQATA